MDSEEVQGEDGSNALILPGSKKKQGKGVSKKDQEQLLKVSKNMQRKLRRLQEEEEKKKLRVQVLETLEKHKLADDKFALLHSSGTLGQEESMKEKLQRAMNYKRAGLPVPASIPLFRQRPGGEQIEEDPAEEHESVRGAISLQAHVRPSASIKANGDGLVKEKLNTNPRPVVSQVRDAPTIHSKHMPRIETPVASKGLKRKVNGGVIEPFQAEDKYHETGGRFAIRGEEARENTGSEPPVIEAHHSRDEKPEIFAHGVSNKWKGMGKSVVCPTEVNDLVCEKAGKKKRKNSSSEEITSLLHSDTKVVTLQEANVAGPRVHNWESHETPKKKKKKKKKSVIEETNVVEDDVARREEAVPVGPEDILSSVRPQDAYLKEALNTQVETGDLKLRKVVVPIKRPEDVAKGRENLPIVMMEQEIVEAISENDVVIVCGETGCGKTTQVPQFLYEAGFGSSLCPETSGVIGVTQPRRVAVLATAKRVAYEMNVGLGQEVGFQVRHDRKIGDKSCVKFMTDGILLREVQADFLLQRYSVIILDEAHERSLNTDILIGMLSRILPLRKSIYEDYCKKKKSLCNTTTASENPIMPLKLVIMSATLRVEDFTSNRRMFAVVPPVIQVPARQFPVTVHFSAKTELLDYVGRAQKKVCAIHRKLPPGGILVFVTGQREVEYLCRKLRKAFRPLKGRDELKGVKSEADDLSKEADVQGMNMKSITDAMDGHLDNSTGADGSGLGFAEPDENNGEKNGDSELSDSGDEDFSREGEDDSMSDSDEEEVVNLQSSLDVVQDATKSSTDVQTAAGKEPVSSTIGNEVTMRDAEKEKRDQSTDPGPLYVLPLYAMLPAAAQLRVFAQVPEGARLVVVATNVAETSITIPGIRYVVDTGRSKERDFDRVNGVSKYEVRWISKASANQRAGRAGRTGPGHCYRLYSSAVFNNIFPKFAPPEMSTAPIEGVVLVMKRMGITKVVNFPFPTPPERQALVEAERCLRALSALDSETGLLTPIGKGMAVYPISPRHARMLLAALHASQEMDGKGHIVLAYAVAAAAALSLESPFLRESGIDTEEDPSVSAAQSKAKEGRTLTDAKSSKSKEKGKSSKDDDSEMTEADRAKRKQRRAAAGRAHGKFRNTHSDALSVVNALWAYEKSNNREEFCETNFLHGKTMQEMAKLRHQLSQLVIQYSLDAGAQITEHFEGKGGSSLTKDYLLESEKAWQSQEQQKLNINQEMVLQQAICAGWADRVARRLSARERALIVEEDGKRKAIRYQACAVEETVFLHPASALAREAPEFVVYNEIISTARPYMWGVTGVQANWLVTHATPLCTFSKPVADPPPWYDHLSDKVMCWVLPSFGPHLWELPPHPFPMKNGKIRAAVFAAALLQGKVLPSFSSLLPHLSADPAIIHKPESHAQQRVGELLHKLGTGPKAVDTREKLALAWQQDPTFLYPEVLAWVQSKAHTKLKHVWRQVQQEAEMGAAELYGKTSKKKKS